MRKANLSWLDFSTSFTTVLPNRFCSRCFTINLFRTGSEEYNLVLTVLTLCPIKTAHDCLCLISVSSIPKEVILVLPHNA